MRTQRHEGYDRRLDLLVQLRTLLRELERRAGQATRRREGVWDEADHPRQGEGADNPGWFAPVDGAVAAGHAEMMKGARGEAPYAFEAPQWQQNPGKDANRDGVTDEAIIGVPADATFRSIPALPNLYPDERAVELAFRNAFEGAPGALVRSYMNDVADSEFPNVFSTDDVKFKSDNYATKEERAIYNVVLHQVANAVAKIAFLTYLDETVAKLPPEQQRVLVTAGGCGAGKSTGLKALKIDTNSFGAVWDAAGEANNTELPWVLNECRKRGLRMEMLYVDNDPYKKIDGVIERAKNLGRMVDASAFVDSYVIGAHNADAFYRQHKDDPDVGFRFVSARGKEPAIVTGVPDEALKMDRNDVQRHVNERLAQPGLPDWLVRGATITRRIFGYGKT